MPASTLVQTKLSSYMSRVFAWMFYGVVISGISALIMYSSPVLQYLIFGNSLVFYTILIAEFITVILVSRVINRINTLTAIGLFTLYSFLTGLTLSVVLFAYAPMTLVSALLMTASVYGIMAIIGYTTKVNLSGLGTFFMMSVIGIIIASIVNIFLQSDAFSVILSYMTIVVFAGLTAYDMQRIRQASEMGITENRYAILDALGMYINFINIFLSILNITGRD